MKRLALILFILQTSSGSAMNWEGHDDWMEDQSEALACAVSVPDALPLLPDACSTI